MTSSHAPPCVTQRSAAAAFQSRGLSLDRCHQRTDSRCWSPQQHGRGWTEFRTVAALAANTVRRGTAQRTEQAQNRRGHCHRENSSCVCRDRRARWGGPGAGQGQGQEGQWLTYYGPFAPKKLLSKDGAMAAFSAYHAACPRCGCPPLHTAPYAHGAPRASAASRSGSCYAPCARFPG